MFKKILILSVFILITSLSWAHHHRGGHHGGHSHGGSPCYHPVHSCPIILANPGIHIQFNLPIYGNHYSTCQIQYSYCIDSARYSWDPYGATYFCQVQFNRCLNGYYY